jgi:hypothetical protein
MTNRYQLILSLLLLTVYAEAKNNQIIQPEIRLRYEALADPFFFSKKFNTSFITFRTGLKVELPVTSNVIIHVDPQYSNLWAMEPVQTSNEQISLFEGWAEWISNYVRVKLGRQELSLGKERLIGRSDWGQLPRSFDALRMDYFYNFTHISFWAAKVNTLSGGISSLGDNHDFYGTQCVFHPEWLNDFEIYILRNQNQKLLRPIRITTTGARLFYSNPNLNFEFEGAYQAGQLNNIERDDYFLNFAIGHTFSKFERLDTSIEYSVASKNFNSLFASAHNFLGDADFFGRRNIQDVIFHSQLFWAEVWQAKIDFHNFLKVNNNSPIYQTNSNTALLSSDAKGSADVGREIDFQLSRNLSLFSISFGLGYFKPGDLFLNSLPKVKDSTFVWVELSNSF